MKLSENVYVLQITPPKSQNSESESFIEIEVEGLNGFGLMRKAMERACIIEYPTLRKGFEEMKRIGKGAQAVVDHYRKKEVEDDEIVDYAVKTYII